MKGPRETDAAGIAKIIRARGGARSIALLLDFDGTVSPIAKTPGAAILPPENRLALERCTGKFPVAIITGRALADIKKKVGIRGIFYAGNHGLEWSYRGRSGSHGISGEALSALVAAKRALRPLARRYPGTLVEDKDMTVSFHYRNLDRSLRSPLKKDLAHITARFAKRASPLRATHEPLTYELKPAVDWHKGAIARKIVSELEREKGRKLVPIYIGDGKTDEDAFRALRGCGITVRVRRAKSTAARYAFKDRKQVDLLLSALASL